MQYKKYSKIDQFTSLKEFRAYLEKEVFKEKVRIYGINSLKREIYSHNTLQGIGGSGIITIVGESGRKLKLYIYYFVDRHSKEEELEVWNTIAF